MSHACAAHYTKGMESSERTKLVQVRVSERELATLHDLATAADLSVSQLVRRLVREEADRRGVTDRRERRHAT